MIRILTGVLSLILFLQGCSVPEETQLQANSDYGKSEYIRISKFYADWCPPCQALKPEYEKVSQLYPHVVFEAVNVDQEGPRARQARVSTIPVVIKSRNGQEVARKLGYMSQNDLIRFIEQ
jgi:thioredoxin 1